MATARRLIVDPSVTPWYHCISRCVRRTIISDKLKRLIVKRMIELSEIFTIETASYGVLDTHMHQLVRLDVKRMKNLTRTEVLQRWARLHPPRGADRKPLKDIRPWLREKLKDKKFVKETRRRLCDLGWYMKELKEYAAVQANFLYDEDGVFWSGRYKSIAVLDEAALVATSIYIDLNPFAAGIVPLPELAEFSSLRLRSASLAGEANAEPSLWLCPINDLLDDGNASRRGLIEGLTLDQYLCLLDETSRRKRAGKATLSEKASQILERLRATTTHWEAVFDSLERGRWTGVYFAFQRQSLRDAAGNRGCHHVDNLNGCATDVGEPNDSARNRPNR